MYSIAKAVIESGRYELAEMLVKIDVLWIQGRITDQEKTELIDLARSHAVPENSYASLERQMVSLSNKLNDLEARILVLEGNNTEPEEYPEFIQPTGALDAYNSGDKVSYKGKKYICQMDGCVWSPDVYPDAWEEVA